MHRTVFLIVFLTSFFIYAQAGSSPHRGLWVVRYSLLSAEETAELIQTANDLKITDLYIQVRALGKSFFVEDALQESVDTSKALQNFKSVVQKAHLNNIRVHAWINAFYVFSGNPENVSSIHLFSTGRNALLRTAKHVENASKKDLKKAGIEGSFVDPINQKNLGYINNLVRYLTDTLDVDGIHLDYFRYPSFEYSFSPEGRTAFMLEHYLDPVDIYTQKYEFSALRILDKKYKNFLNQNISKALFSIRQNLAKAKRKTELSIAVKPNPFIAKNTFLQDWPAWLRDGLCDKVVLMNYNADDRVFYDNVFLSQQLNRNKNIIMGISTFNQQDSEVLKRMYHISKSNFAGFTLFSFNDLRLKPNLINLIKRINDFPEEQQHSTLSY